MLNGPRRRSRNPVSRRGDGGFGSRRRRLLAVIAAFTLFGGLFAVTHVASANDKAEKQGRKLAASQDKNVKKDPNAKNSKAPKAKAKAKAKNADPNADNNDNNNDNNNNADKNKNGLDILATNCDDSKLREHDGFQKGNRCVTTEFGEVSAAAKNPSLLITKAPDEVRANQPFSLKVSSANLVRDRFLGAADGGYYVESSLLNGQGLERGHFHTACRMLQSADSPPDPADVPAFFVATEDNKGGADPDEVTIRVPGLPDSGVAQCAVWAGDGSHRIPMMERANQTPAFDAVRIKVDN
jgi:hypothetical protein